MINFIKKVLPSFFKSEEVEAIGYSEALAVSLDELVYKELSNLIKSVNTVTDVSIDGMEATWGNISKMFEDPKARINMQSSVPYLYSILGTEDCFRLLLHKAGIKLGGISYVYPTYTFDTPIPFDSESPDRLFDNHKSCLPCVKAYIELLSDVAIPTQKQINTVRSIVNMCIPYNIKIQEIRLNNFKIM